MKVETGNKTRKRLVAMALVLTVMTSWLLPGFSPPAYAQYRMGGFCAAPQYPSFSCGTPRCMPIAPRFLPGRCAPGFTYGCVPFVPAYNPMPFFFGSSLINETVTSFEIPSNLNADGTTQAGTGAKDRIEKLIPSLTNDREIPDTTGSTNKDMSSVMDSVFKTGKSSNSSDAACKRAGDLCKSGSFAEALKLVDQESNSSDPSNHSNASSACLYVRAHANLGLGKLEEALDDLHRSQKSNPDYAPAYFTEGSILSELNRLPDAVKAYSKALSLKSNFPKALDARAAAYYRLGQFLDAIRDYERALTLDSKDANALYMRGLCYFMVGQYQMVPICYNDYLALFPKDVAALSNRASSFFELGKYPEALADFNAVLAMEPKNVNALYKRCLLYWHLGRWQDAANDANNALSVSSWKDENAAYLALCSYLLALKQKNGEAAAQTLLTSLNSLDSKSWPYPLFQYFAGKVTESELFLMATTKDQWTQARTYVALHNAWGQSADKKKAMALLEKVRADGDASVPEYNIAVKEIFRGGAKDITNIARPVRNRFALVVGVSKFKDQSINLKYCDKDAQDFSSFLIGNERFQKENVKLMTNEEATRENILSALGDTWLPRHANKEDLVLIYFSTHGSPSAMDAKGINYLLAHDTDKEMLYATGIPVQDLTRMIKDKVHADRVVVIMDACHSGSAKTDDRLKLDAQDIAQESGQAVICSSMPEEVSWESKQYQNSVFTHHLMAGLKSKGLATSLADSFAYTKERVSKEVLTDRSAHQTPVMKSTWTKADLAIAAQ